MPTISMFFGIIIRMFNNGSEHNPPHFHAKYQDYSATFTLDGELKEGEMPKAQKNTSLLGLNFTKMNFLPTGNWR